MDKILKNKKRSLAIFFFVLYIKGIIFTLIASGSAGISVDFVKISYYLIPPQVAILGVIVFPAFFLKDKGVIRYLSIVNIIYSVLFVLDLWIYRGSGNFFGLKYIIFKGLFNPQGNSLFNPRILDIILLIDLPAYIYIYSKTREQITIRRNIKLAVIGILASLSIALGGHYLFDVKKAFGTEVRFIQDGWETSYNPTTKVLYRSPIGNQVYEGYKALCKLYSVKNEDEMKQVDEWLEWNNERLPDNEFKGIAKGKNVVFLQIESLENFVINQKVYGQEITPNMNKLVNGGMYFSNIYEQNNAGNSIDADMMTNTGVLPLGDTITFLSYPEVKYNSFQRILKTNGYTSVSTHAEKTGDWGWAEAHKNALGFDDMWDVNDYTVDEKVGFGLSDRSFYTQYAEKLSTLKEPFFSCIPTLTSHGPFDIAKQYRKLNLPEDLDKTKLGGYFQSVNYADEQIGLFFDLLDKYGLKDDTIVVIYGDHGGIHKYYMDDLKEINLDGNWWQNYKKQVPLIICGKDLPNKKIDTIGGQVDIVQTVSYLLGVETGNTTMGRNLLNTKRDATVIKGSEVIGHPTEQEKQRLEEAYKIAEYSIKNNYFENRGMIK